MVFFGIIENINESKDNERALIKNVHFALNCVYTRTSQVLINLHRNVINMPAVNYYFNIIGI